MNTTQLRELAEAAEQGGCHVYTSWRDSNKYMENQAWHKAASPAAILALLDRIKELEAVEQAYEALKASLGDPVAFLVEGWNGKKRIACVLSHNIEDAKFSAGEFSQHYPTIHTRNLYALKEPT